MSLQCRLRTYTRASATVTALSSGSSGLSRSGRAGSWTSTRLRKWTSSAPTRASCGCSVGWGSEPNGRGASLRRLQRGLAPHLLPPTVPLHEDISDAARPGDISLGRALNGLPSREDRGVAEDSDFEISEFQIRPLHVARHRLGDLLRLVQHRSVGVGVEVVVSQESLQRRAVLLELSIRHALLEFDDLLLCRTCCLSPGSTAGEQSQQRNCKCAFHGDLLRDRRRVASCYGIGFKLISR